MPIPMSPRRLYHLGQQLAGAGSQVQNDRCRCQTAGMGLCGDRRENVLADASCEEPCTRGHCVARVASVLRPAVVRLQKVDVAGSGDVEGVAPVAHQDLRLLCQRPAATAHGTGKSGRLHRY